MRRNFLSLTLICCYWLINCHKASSQFLFTYEINSQDDESRAPKSSLFDPNSFKIVTPAQLASSYQKLATTPLSEPSNQLLESPPPPAPAQTRATSPLSSSTRNTNNLSESPSLLKQTSSALQSFADLFSLSPSSSPTPLPVSGTNLANVERHQQQAEARSLHEHWTQQQQKSHQDAAFSAHHANPAQHQSALNSFTSGVSNNHINDHQLSPGALQLNHLHQFHTQNHNQQQQQQQQQPSHTPQASYWLTANPLNSQDGNFLVQIKQQQQQQPHHSHHIHQQQQVAQAAPVAASPQLTSPATIVDNLLSMGSPRSVSSSSSSNPKIHHHSASHPGRSHLAQDSFLSTPTSYYPSPSEPSVRHQSLKQVSSQPAFNHHHHQQQRNQVQVPHSNHPQLLMSRYNSTQSAVSPYAFELEGSQQLSPPVNLPENFLSASQQPVHHKSAEESLISFRQQQQQHDQQNALFSAQNHLASQQQQQQQKQTPVTANVQKQHILAPIQKPVLQSSSQSTSDIPKVSPQIYESFLLQRKDQQEKHMELLKQQREIMNLMEQRQKQQELEKEKEKEKEARRKRKKEELEREVQRKKAQAKEIELARKAKLEAEERELRRKRDEEERKRAAEEERKYREFLEAEKEREKEREREREKEREREIQRRQQQVAEAEAARKKAKEAEESKFLRQKEELKKLLELKQLEEEADQRRRKQQLATTFNQQERQQQQPPVQQQQQQQRSLQAMRANRIAQELRDRVAGQSWGAPIRSSRLQQSSNNNYNYMNGESPTSSVISAPLSAPTTVAPTLASVSSTEKAEHPTKRQRIPTRVVKKQRTSVGQEKLIRQKIPLYSGPGQYGLYRGTNDSIANDLAALLDSVTLPAQTSSTSSSTTQTSSSSTTTPAPSLQEAEPSERSRSTSEYSLLSSTTMASLQDQSRDTSSSLSPLLIRSNQQSAITSMDEHSVSFDDDVPRRPARGLTQTSTRAQPLVSAQVSRTVQANSSSSSSSVLTAQPQAATSRAHAHIGLASLPTDSDNDGIPGRAGVEYPVLSSVPSTSFSCSKQPLNGYYADTETACQVVHLCQAGVQSSILCPNGTIFNQEKFSCQWWYEVNCSRAPMFYQLNDNLYKATTQKGSPSSTFDNERDDLGDDDDDEDEADSIEDKPKPKSKRKKLANAAAAAAAKLSSNRSKQLKTNSNSLLSVVSS